jgi:predicted nucleotidyltransferase
MSKTALRHLNPRERQALIEFWQRLKERFAGALHSALLFGSKARGRGQRDSALDVFVVVNSDDWRVHKEIRFVAADISLEYGLDLSPRVWSTSHLGEMKRLGSVLVQSIQREGVNLSDL